MEVQNQPHNDSTYSQFPQSDSMAAQSKYDYSYKKWLADNQDILEILRNRLQGKIYMERVDDSGIIYGGWEKNGDSLTDDETINLVVQFVDATCSKHNMQACYRPEESKLLIRDAMEFFIVWIGLRKLKGKMKFGDIEYITSTVNIYIEAGYSRAVKGKERNLLHTVKTHATSVFSNNDYGQKKESYKDFQEGKN